MGVANFGVHVSAIFQVVWLQLCVALFPPHFATHKAILHRDVLYTSDHVIKNL